VSKTTRTYYDTRGFQKLIAKKAMPKCKNLQAKKPNQHCFNPSYLCY